MSESLIDIKSDVHNEFLNIEKGQGWNNFFNTIRTECAEKYTYSTFEAKRSENKDLNRYKDVSPYDHSRIRLSKGSTDYINANLVEVSKANRKYILTQGPLLQTTSHFWLMIWEQNCRAIVMLNRIVEKHMIKCHQYWPMQESYNQDKTFVFSDVNLKVTNLSEVKESHYTTTILRLEELSTGHKREIIHYHYTTWPDFGVPQSPAMFLRFLKLVRSSGVLEDAGPAVIHCSAGIGRSGTFCLVDSSLVMIQEMKLKNIVVKEILMEMRKYRMGLVQTPGQLRFSYLSIINGLDKADFENGVTDEDNKEIKEHNSEEEPPPLPPPRNESLKRSYSDAIENHEITEHNKVDQAEDFSTVHQRRKEKEEKNKKLEMKVKEIKKKLEESESWRKWKKSVFHPWSIGCIIVGAGIVVYALLASRV